MNLKEIKNNCLNSNQGNINIQLNEMERRIQDLKTELSKGIGILNGTHRGKALQVEWIK